MSDHAERTSERLRRIVATGETPQISIGNPAAGPSDRAFGIILLILALPLSIPTIPGLVFVIAIGFIERDGPIVLLGHLLAAVAVVATFGIVVGLIVGALPLISAWFG